MDSFGWFKRFGLGENILFAYQYLMLREHWDYNIQLLGERMAKRYCGNCGKIIKKKKQVCEDCDIPYKEYKNPYHELPSWMKKSIIFFGIVAVIWLIFNILLWITNTSGARPLSVTAVMLFFMVFISYHQTKNQLKSGLKKCRKCEKNSSLHALYCIHCGNKIKWRYKPVK